MLSSFRLRRPGAESVQIGDRFLKSNEPHSAVWVVAEIVEAVPGLPHARLVRQHAPNTRGRVTVSLVTLGDHGYYVPFRGPMPAAAE